MPQYRKLSTRTPESFDFNDLPDDFTRLTWLQLPLVSCSDGRGIDIPGWLIGRIYPLRQDVTADMIDAAMSAFEAHGMVERYSIDGRSYYQIINWTKYQGNTDKESDSPYPAPELVGSRSRVGTEQVGSKSALDADADADAMRDADAERDANAKSGASAPARPRSRPRPSTSFPIPPELRTWFHQHNIPDPQTADDLALVQSPTARSWLNITMRWPGWAALRQIFKSIGPQPDESALRRVWDAWTLNGYSVRNVAGILERYHAEIDRAGPAANGHGRSSPTPNRPTREGIEAAKARFAAALEGKTT